ncbi:NADPH-dependent glutamate synthase beta subunit-like oxidoreductase [Streptomyces sp. SAI-229]
MPRAAFIGSGPSGRRTARSLVQQDARVRADVLDRLPRPYGPVRYGVAPDHEKIKSPQHTLRAVPEHERVRFPGGMPAGPDSGGHRAGIPGSRTPRRAIVPGWTPARRAGSRR